MPQFNNILTRAQFLLESSTWAGQPNRQLGARLKEPFQTIRHPRKDLAQKAHQTRALTARLRSPADQTFLNLVADAFDNFFSQLRFLTGSRVFRAAFPAHALLSALYLLPRGNS